VRRKKQRGPSFIGGGQLFRCEWGGLRRVRARGLVPQSLQGGKKPRRAKLGENYREGSRRKKGGEGSGNTWGARKGTKKNGNIGGGREGTNLTVNEGAESLIHNSATKKTNWARPVPCIGEGEKRKAANNVERGSVNRDRSRHFKVLLSEEVLQERWAIRAEGKNIQDEKKGGGGGKTGTSGSGHCTLKMGNTRRGGKSETVCILNKKENSQAARRPNVRKTFNKSKLAGTGLRKDPKTRT